MTKKNIRFALLTMLLVCSAVVSAGTVWPPVASAQGGVSCAAAMEQAIAAAASSCRQVAPGTLCAGAGQVEVFSADGGRLGPSAVIALDAVERVETRGAETAGAVPGISVLRLPGLAEGESLTAVLFGDASLAHEQGPPVAPLCNAVSIGTVNIRQEPNTGSAILGQLSPGDSAPITARLADSSWWHIQWEGQDAWIFAQLAPADCDANLMLVVDPATGELSGGLPAPAFQGGRLQTSFTAPVCAGAPRGGLLLQSGPAGASWRVNRLVLTVVGTALVQASQDDILAVQVLEGRAILAAEGVNRQAEAGQMIRAPMRSGAIEQAPGPALVAVSEDIATAPIGLLPRPITPPAVTQPIPQAQSGEALTCAALTQQVAIEAVGGRASVPVSLGAGQAIRVSASGAGVAGLAVRGPDGGEQLLVQGAGTALVASFAAEEAGTHTFVADGVTGSLLFGFTCDLPRTSPAAGVRACQDTLLRWDAVSGGEVRFFAPAGALVSAIAQHALPSEGDAQRLGALAEDGQQIAESVFASVQSSRVAGPLEFSAPADGEYILRWDGDPFNLIEIEVLCLPPTPGVSEGE